MHHEGSAICAVGAPLCMKLPFPDSLQQYAAKVESRYLDDIKGAGADWS